MDLEQMSREELLEHVRELNRQMENVVVLWGGKKELRETLEEVSRNESNAYTQEEATNARIILESERGFEDFIELLRDSFERGGINYAISEKMSALMEETANRYRK